MSALDLTADANPQTQVGTGGAAPTPAELDDFSQYYLPFDPLAQTAMQSLMAPAPEDATDSQYLAEMAQYRNTLAKDYGDALAQLGYLDPTSGAYIPGSLVSQARIQEAQAREGQRQAILGVTQNAQNQGILFSGMRGVLQGQAETPYVQQIASIENTLPQSMAEALRNAKQAISDYSTNEYGALQSAAARRAAAAMQNPVDTSGGGMTSGGGGTSSSGGPTGVPQGTQVDTGPTIIGTPSSSGGQAAQAFGLPGPASATQYQLLPYRRVGHSPGVAYMARGGEVDGPTPAVIGEQGPEAVGPRTGLTPPENDALTHLRNVASARLGGHWFGPGGSGIFPSPPQQPIGPGGAVRGILPPVIPPAQMLQSAGLHDQAVDMWMQHHPGAMLGRARGVPSWVHAAVAHALANLHNPGID